MCEFYGHGKLLLIDVKRCWDEIMQISLKSCVQYFLLNLVGKTLTFAAILNVYFLYSKKVTRVSWCSPIAFFVKRWVKEKGGMDSSSHQYRRLEGQLLVISI